MAQWSLLVLSNPQKYQCDSMGLHKFFHHSAIVLCITFHIWKSVDCYFSNKVYRDILRNSYVLTKTLKCLCTLYLKNSNLQIFIHEKLCMKLQLIDEKTRVDPWSHIGTFEGWTVLTETIVIFYNLQNRTFYIDYTKLLKICSTILRFSKVNYLYQTSCFFIIGNWKDSFKVLFRRFSFVPLS